MTPAGILESALYVDDLDKAEAFYRDVLGLERKVKTEGRQVFFRCGNSMLLLFNAAATETPPPQDARLPVPPHGARGDGHLCFRATGEEIEAWRAHLTAHGVAIEADFVWPSSDPESTGGRSIYFRDPAGNSLEFAEPKIWGME